MELATRERVYDRILFRAVSDVCCRCSRRAHPSWGPRV